MADVLRGPLGVVSPVDQSDSLRLQVTQAVARSQRSENGQFMTPPTVSRVMAHMFGPLPAHVRLLDPGAGVGALTAAFVERLLSEERLPNSVRLVSFEAEATFIEPLRSVVDSCVRACRDAGIEAAAEVHQMDFLAQAEYVGHQPALFGADVTCRHFTHAILNPPYKKLASTSEMRKALRSVGIDTTNLYAAFTWLSFLLLADGGEIVAITPRSYCNGPYFAPFRKALLASVGIQQLHAFRRRDRAFRDDDVLQETLILHGVRGAPAPKTVVLRESDGLAGADVTQHEVPFEQVVHLDDPQTFIHVITDQASSDVVDAMASFTASLGDMGLTVSTGRVVDFRAREVIHDEEAGTCAPLLYPTNIRDGRTLWPMPDGRKPQYIDDAEETAQLLIPNGIYVVVKRFTAKEESRRLVAAVHDSAGSTAQYARVGFENHLNYFHEGGQPVDGELARGLAAYLNTSFVDAYFRQFSGHTQVNANDLRKLRYPSRVQLVALGQRVGDACPAQGELDAVVGRELQIMSESVNSIAGKKLSADALEILKALGVPREQQNERSALTLLALLDLRPGGNWHDAAAPLRGITQMMDYFRDHFGKNYAPNTRETVRRQTVHQFVQMGLVLENPDQLSRPINSPKTVYQIEPNALALFRQFATAEWNPAVQRYIGASKSLGRLHARERTMAMLPVTLSDGRSINLSGGGQNELIKSLLEEFCPRFTPKGQVLYIGDAGQKFLINETAALRALGVEIDEHGKMPDIVVYLPDRNWLVLIEAVTSHGPVNIKRHNELKVLFGGSTAGLVFVTAFPSRREMNRFLAEIAWATEVWVADAPSHLIHFNGERFLGPYE